MLQIELRVNGRRIGKVDMVRGGHHPRFDKPTYWYSYHGEIVGQDGKTTRYAGRVLHSYQNGAVALTQKVLKAITKEQKLVKSPE